jgi:hypothetical protein
MPNQALKRSFVSALLGLFIAVPASALASAAPAFAEGDGCCQVSVDNMPGRFSSGGDPERFTLRVMNRTQETVRYFDVSFVLQASGLVGDLVHLQRQRVSGGSHSVGTFTLRGVHSGVVTANDQIDLATVLPPGREVNVEYLLSFNKKTPSSPLTLSVQVHPSRSNVGLSSAGPYQSMIVATGQPIQTQAQPSATTAASDAPTAADATGVVAAPTDQPSLDSTSSGGTSLLWLAYTVGALLILSGGVIGALLLRRGSHPVENNWHKPKRHSHPTSPTPPLGSHAFSQANYEMPAQTGSDGSPTQVVPTVNYRAVRHAAPTRQFPVLQDPFADQDQTWTDPGAGR